ncbi:unannotated protein [freshwater metagenome]|uniref:Unannotated protein n=1 Tax=freshwater metagenome TaxID=449393 RepID=A0A6J7JM48_9ZZZZ
MTGRVERVVDADAVGSRVAGADHVGLRGVDHVCRAEVQRGLAACCERVGRDDLRRTCDARALHHRDADAAQTHHEHGGTHFDLGRVEDCADAGLDCTANHCREIERHVDVDLDDSGLGSERVLAEAADTQPPIDGFTVAAQCGRAVGEQAGHEGARFDADGLLAADTEVAAATRCHGHRDDVIAWRHRTNARADRFDDACRLVSEDHR